MRKKTDTYYSFGTCQFTGKQKYPDRLSAKRAAQRVAKGLHVYRCDQGCGNWHFGHDYGWSREKHREHHELKAQWMKNADLS